ncbi:hypothetical protein [Paenibacillus medicaginis]|uniref:Uncharacterized protein n=1 Tax=Paenibacillus medicaginis TaxID=1470560 RepID=A0ABV5C966_9BACL
MNEARVKSNSTKNKDYQVYKDFIRNRYDFASIFGGANQYNYLYDLLTGTSAYNNSAGKSDWAREQLLSAYQKWTDVEVLAIAAGGMIGGNGGTKGKSKGTGKFDDGLTQMYKDVALGRGSTGRTVPNNLNEQLAMKEVLSVPLNSAKELKSITMTDSRWLSKDGWVKMSKNVNGIEIHFVYNAKTGAFDDFKFK